MAFYALRRDPYRSTKHTGQYRHELQNNKMNKNLLKLSWKNLLGEITFPQLFNVKITYFAVVNLKEISERFRKERSFLMNSQRE
jgi:hypothetical protein